MRTPSDADARSLGKEVAACRHLVPAGARVKVTLSLATSSGQVSGLLSRELAGNERHGFAHTFDLPALTSLAGTGLILSAHQLTTDEGAPETTLSVRSLLFAKNDG